MLTLPKSPVDAPDCNVVGHTPTCFDQSPTHLVYIYAHFSWSLCTIKHTYLSLKYSLASNHERRRDGKVPVHIASTL